MINALARIVIWATLLIGMCIVCAELILRWAP